MRNCFHQEKHFLFSHRKKEEEMQEERESLLLGTLQILNGNKNQEHVIREILNAIKKFLGFDAVGIRLVDGEDFPYFVTEGFSNEFYLRERSLLCFTKEGEIAKNKEGQTELACMCGSIIRRRFDPKLDFFTKFGSFWTNSTSALLASTSEADRQGRTRNRCNEEGYETVSLIPLIASEKCVGLLQLNNRKKDSITLDLVEFFEKLGAAIAIAFERMADQKNEKLLQIQLRHAQKMEALGRLIGSLAHEFNNILASIMGAVAVMESGYLNIEQSKECCADILHAARIGAGLTKRLLSNERENNADAKYMNLNETIDQMRSILEIALGKEKKLVLDLAPEETMIIAKSDQIEQILLNVIHNARGANCKSVEICTTIEEKNFFSKEQLYVLMTVKDNGDGISDETLQNAFEPLYTTKPIGEGTGIGLFVAYNIIKAHNGWIEMKRNDPHAPGVTVNIWLPYTNEEQTQKEVEVTDKPYSRKKRTILLVEDENLVRKVVARALEHLGYNVCCANDGLNALNLLRNGLAPSLLLTDEKMPSLFGHQLIAQVRQIEGLSDMKIILMSGNPQSLTEQQQSLTDIPTIGKPFEIDELCKIIDKALD